MSQLYGLLAGLFVGLATWAATVYVSELAGLCVGLFLLTFFAVSTIYLTGDDLLARQKVFSKALVDLEMILLDRFTTLEEKVGNLEAMPGGHSPVDSVTEPDVQAVDAMLHTLEAILEAKEPPPSQPAPRSRPRPA
jgi:hypothetical protein